MQDIHIEFDHSSFSEKVYSAILELLIHHRVRPGEKISEKSIASSLNVSRTPVREALRRLAADGLVDYYPRRGVYAKEITPQDIRELYEIRRCLEVQAAQMTIGNIPAAHIASIDALIEVCHKSDGVDFIEAELRLDREIHRAITMHCGNKRLMMMLVKLDHLAKFMRVLHFNREEVVRDNFSEHENIWNALKEQDKDTMVRLLEQHLDNRQNCLLSDFHMMHANGRHDSDATV